VLPAFLAKTWSPFDDSFRLMYEGCFVCGVSFAALRAMHPWRLPEPTFAEDHKSLRHGRFYQHFFISLLSGALWDWGARGNCPLLWNKRFHRYGRPSDVVDHAAAAGHRLVFESKFAA
jgi:hypothetical protein